MNTRYIAAMIEHMTRRLKNHCFTKSLEISRSETINSEVIYNQDRSEKDLQSTSRFCCVSQSDQSPPVVNFWIFQFGISRSAFTARTALEIGGAGSLIQLTGDPSSMANERRQNGARERQTPR